MDKTKTFRRFGRQFKVYERILPSQLLDVTDVVSSSPRQCVICAGLAELECAACYGDHDQVNCILVGVYLCRSELRSS